jgi:2-dehydro-3-deoxygluconokinase
MVELARGDDRRFGLAYGGDTFNTAVYLARAGVNVAYLTALGDDTYSQGILDLARAERVNTDHIQIVSGRMPGLYLIETTASGERSFSYWRDRAPAREVFDAALPEATIAALVRAPLLYLSGITLSLYQPTALDRLASYISQARSQGARFAMDGNYRPRGWVGDTARAKSVFEQFWSMADVALPTFDDENALWGDASPQATIGRLTKFGVGEIIVKSGPDGAHLSHEGTVSHVPIPAPVTPIDTTAAGDSFNAGYLAARIKGAPPAAAALAGHHLAAIVIQHRGAIVPKIATAAMFD